MNSKKPLVLMRGVEAMEDQIERTKSKDWRERKQALKEICPCKVEKDIDLFWCARTLLPPKMLFFHFSMIFMRKALLHRLKLCDSRLLVSQEPSV